MTSDFKLQKDLENKVQEILKRIQSHIESHGGSIEYVGVRNKTVYLKLLGTCDSCPSSLMTLYHGIQSTMQEELGRNDIAIEIYNPLIHDL